MPLACTIRTSDRTHYDGPADWLDLPLPSGQVRVLPGHAEAFMALVAGTVRLQPQSSEPITVGVSGGSCWVSQDRVTVVV
jgi:F-type H+-transporting ATPase subunit epsilon